MGMPAMEPVPAFFVWIFALFMSSIIMWDAFVVTHPSYGPSISSIIFYAAQRWPALPFAVGFMCGHLFSRNP